MDQVIDNILVSVIMPAYNASNYIQEAIDSVRHQTFTNWELIIIDDGSTDDTSSIILNNINLDSRIKGLYQKNGKPGKARNLGIENAGGSYIAFLDADDIWLPEKLEIQLEEIKKQNVDLVFSDAFIFHDDNPLDKSNKMNTVRAVLEGDEALKLFLKNNRIPTLTVLVKKEIIKLVNGFTEKAEIPLAEDYHLWLKMLIKGCVFYGSDKTLAAYRMHDMASTNKDKLASDQILEVFYDLKQKYPEVRPIILPSLKRKLRKRYVGIDFSKLEFNRIIYENCRYLDKQYVAPLFKLAYMFLGIEITKKILNRLLNA